MIRLDGGTQRPIDPEFIELARDVRNQVHKDYFLAGLPEQGIAYHIGYLHSAIRMRIEKLFKDERLLPYSAQAHWLKAADDGYSTTCPARYS